MHLKAQCPLFWRKPKPSDGKINRMGTKSVEAYPIRHGRLRRFLFHSTRLRSGCFFNRTTSHYVQTTCCSPENDRPPRNLKIECASLIQLAHPSLWIDRTCCMISTPPQCKTHPSQMTNPKESKEADSSPYPPETSNQISGEAAKPIGRK